MGRRRQKTVNGVTTAFLYNGLDVVQELDGTTPIANLLTGLGIGEVLTRTDAVGMQGFLSDGLGSTLAPTDPAGSVLTEYTYEPFGKTAVLGAASTNAFKYTGREDDGTGLYYYRGRYYHPGLQRFISQDPIGFAGGDVNLFAYVGNAPLDFVDPNGLAKGGKEKLQVGEFNKKSPAGAVERALQKALKAGKLDHARKLRGLLKVIKRGGSMGILLDFAFPDDAGADDDMLPPDRQPPEDPSPPEDSCQ